MCWTGSMLSGGSPKASPWYEGEMQRRDPKLRAPTFEPDLFRARFTLLRRADHLSEAHQAHLDRLFDAHPRPANRVGRAPRPRPGRPGPTRPAGSLASTPPVRYPNTTTSWTRPSLGEKRSWPTTAADESLTDPSKGSITSSRSYAASLTDSPTTKTTQPEEFSHHDSHTDNSAQNPRHRRSLNRRMSDAG